VTFSATNDQIAHSFRVSLSELRVLYLKTSGFGGLGLASSTQDRRFEPGRSRPDFSSEKIHSIPSFGGEVKTSVPCRRFAACKKIAGKIDRRFLAQFHPSLTQVA
jgi:hypothetical protein